MKKQISSHAATAKEIRKELKKAFPGQKFKVRSDSFSMGNAVRISWINGVTEDAVEEITNKYQYGHFNGMEDMYEISNRRNDIPQVKYITTSRTITNDKKIEVAKELDKFYSDSCKHGDFFNEDGTINTLAKIGGEWLDTMIYRETQKTDYSKEVKKETKKQNKNDKFNLSLVYEF